MRLPWIAALCLFLCAPAAARPYEVDDLLRLEGYGRVLVHPSGAFAIVERRGAWQTAPRFRHDYFTWYLLTKLQRLDAKRGGTAPLFEQEPHAGYWMANFSPSGRRLAVYRLKEGRLSAGIVELATGAVRWLPFTPDLPEASTLPIWLDENRLLYATLSSGELPWWLGFGSTVQRRSQRLWKQADEGRSSSEIALGSGRFADTGARAATGALTLFDLRTGEGQTLLRGTISDFAASADGKHLAIVSEGEMVRLTGSEALNASDDARRRRLSILSLETGASWPVCERCDILPYVLAWSPGRPELLFFARKDGATWQEMELFRARLKDRSVAALTTASLRPLLQRPELGALIPQAAWVGSMPILLAKERSSTRADWYDVGGKRPVRLTSGLPAAPETLLAASSRSFAVLTGGAVWTVDRKGRARRLPWEGLSAPAAATPDPFSVGVRHGIATVPQSPPLLIAKGPTPSSPVRLVDLSRDRPQPCLLPAAPEILGAHAGARFAIGYSHGTGQGRLLRLPCGAPAETLDEINAHLDGVEPARPVRVQSKGPSGETLTHWLLLPPQASSTPPPLVVVPYPGLVYGDAPPPSDLTRWIPQASPQILAGRGYAVLVPSIPLPWETGDPLSKLAAPVEGAIDAVAATGAVDATRVAVYGHSYGGYAALGLAALSKRFHAAIASAGPSDLAGGYGDPAEIPRSDGTPALDPSIAGWAERGQGRMGSPPWRDPQRYIRNSPYYEVEKIEAPVLLLHGDLDAVSVKHAERMFFALYRTGKDALLVRYGGEGHGFTSPANIRHYWEQVFSFLETTIGAPAPRGGSH